MKIVLLHSGQENSERLDTQNELFLAREIEQQLKALHLDHIVIAVQADLSLLAEQLVNYQPDCVINLVEAFAGNTADLYLIPLLLEKLKLPFTGGSSRNFIMTTNKVTSKHWMRLHDIATPEWYTYQEVMSAKHTELEKLYIVKLIAEDSSLAIGQDSVVSDKAALTALIDGRLKPWRSQWFLERYIPGREFAISLLWVNDKLITLPIYEHIFSKDSLYPIIDWSCKWEPESLQCRNHSRRFVFSDKDESLLAKLQHMAITCCNAFELRDYARVDCRVDSEGNIWVLEINVNPDISSDAGFMIAANYAGFEQKSIVEQLIQRSMNQSPLKRV